jgi:hypothetical protein
MFRAYILAIFRELQVWLPGMVAKTVERVFFNGESLKLKFDAMNQH